MDWKAIAYWREPIMFVLSVKGRRFFPLDVKLNLRADHWSEGAVRVAVRQGWLGKSFELTAEAYSDATGGHMSKDSLRRVTEGWGQGVEEKRPAEAKQLYVAEVPQPVSKIVSVNKPIQELANISSDGGMVLLCEEGWKEVKMSVISEVKPKMTPSTKKQEASPDIRTPRQAAAVLTRHSYQAGLWNADEMGQHQYLEGARRQVGLCQRLSSVNDGAPWIDRITHCQQLSPSHPSH
jgi:hypothetical protein